MNPDDVWVDSVGTYRLYDPNLDPDRYDAIGFGVSGSISVHTPVVSLEGSIALEEVIDVDNDEMTTFFVYGGGVNLGYEDFYNKTIEFFVEDNNLALFSLNITPYFAAINNVDDVVEDFSGPFLSETTTAAYKIGAMWGKATAPSAPKKPSPPSSDVFGLVLGTGISRNAGASNYVPLATVNPWATTFSDFVTYP